MAKTKEKTNANTPSTIEEANEIIAQKDQEISELLEVITGLKSELVAASKASFKKDNIVEFKGVNYKVIGEKFHFDGQEHSVSSLSENSELLGKLVELGAGFLEKIEE